MNRKTLSVNPANREFKINSSSKIINIFYNEYDMDYIVEYYESPFADELDVYEIGVVRMSEYADFDEYIGYTLLGKFWDEQIKQYFLLFVKQGDRVKNN